MEDEPPATRLRVGIPAAFWARYACAAAGLKQAVQLGAAAQLQGELALPGGAGWASRNAFFLLHSDTPLLWVLLWFGNICSFLSILSGQAVRRTLR